MLADRLVMKKISYIKNLKNNRQMPFETSLAVLGWFIIVFRLADKNVCLQNVYCLHHSIYNHIGCLLVMFDLYELQCDEPCRD